MYSFGPSSAPGAHENNPKDIASEAIGEIPINRTLLVQKLTTTPSSPKVVEGLKSPDAVFAHFSPQVKVEFTNDQGKAIRETLRFESLSDFGVEGITKQSNFLRDLAADTDERQKLLRQLKSNKILQKVLSDPETRKAYLAAIQAMMDELEKAS